MADNVYVFETYNGAGISSVTDDGSGNDWAVISGTYFAYGYGARIFLDNDLSDAAVTAAWFEIKIESPLLYKSLTVYGVIENAIGGPGTDGIWGNALDNILQGDPSDGPGANDDLFGLDGNDTLYGMGGSDHLSGGNGNDRLYGDDDKTAQGSGNINAGDDWLEGGAGDDILQGGDGTNTLDGGDGIDMADYSGYEATFDGAYSMDANLENNAAHVYWTDYRDGSTYAVASDVLYGVEGVYGTGGDDTIKGRDNFSYGLPGRNFLHGGGGNDTVTGGYWNDELYGDTGDDVIFDGFNLLDDARNNPDHLYGGDGNDTYHVSSETAVIHEQPGQGTDSVIVDAVFSLFTLADDVENLQVLTGLWGGAFYGNAGNNRMIAGTGNEYMSGLGGRDRLSGLGGDDILLGGGGADQLSGGDGSDFLYGEDGNDTLTGGRGGDTLTGGKGRDTMTGGAGNDRFIFLAVADSPVGAGADTITDFVSGRDVIDLSAIDANTKAARDQGFAFIGALGFSNKPGELRFDAGVLEGDTDGNGAADFQILLPGLASLSPITDIVP